MTPDQLRVFKVMGIDPAKAAEGLKERAAERTRLGYPPKKAPPQVFDGYTAEQIRTLRDLGIDAVPGKPPAPLPREAHAAQPDALGLTEAERAACAQVGIEFRDFAAVKQKLASPDLSIPKIVDTIGGIGLTAAESALLDRLDIDRDALAEAMLKQKKDDDVWKLTEKLGFPIGGGVFKKGLC